MSHVIYQIFLPYSINQFVQNRHHDGVIRAAFEYGSRLWFKVKEFFNLREKRGANSPACDHLAHECIACSCAYNRIASQTHKLHDGVPRRRYKTVTNWTEAIPRNTDDRENAIDVQVHRVGCIARTYARGGKKKVASEIRGAFSRGMNARIETNGFHGAHDAIICR